MEYLSCDVLILACNGFGGNQAMVNELLPEMREATFAGHAGNDGSAIAWGKTLGALFHTRGGLDIDADTGFGNALNVMRTVKGFERAGAAMIQIEDQTFPKRCGHLDGKAVVPVGEMVGKLKAALDARTSSDTLILARTDALAVEGLDAAFERAQAYLDAGVDTLFIEALRTPEQMGAACERFGNKVPLLANMVEGGKTPVQSAADLQTQGFKIAIFPGGTARAVAHTLQGYYSSLKQHQTTTPWKRSMLDFDGLNEVIGTAQLLLDGKRYGA